MFLIELALAAAAQAVDLTQTHPVVSGAVGGAGGSGLVTWWLLQDLKARMVRLENVYIRPPNVAAGG